MNTLLKKLDKTFCELDKDELGKYDKQIRKVVKKPKYICKKCVRVSSAEEMLCKPKKL